MYMAKKKVMNVNVPITTVLQIRFQDNPSL